MALKLIPTGQGRSEKEYYIRFEGSMYGELHGRSLRGSLTVNIYKKYVRLADGVVFTEEADGLAGVFVQWQFLDLPVDRINDWGNKVSIMTEEGAAVEILFKKEDGND